MACSTCWWRLRPTRAQTLSTTVSLWRPWLAPPSSVSLSPWATQESCSRPSPPSSWALAPSLHSTFRLVLGYCFTKLIIYPRRGGLKGHSYRSLLVGHDGQSVGSWFVSIYLNTLLGQISSMLLLMQIKWNLICVVYIKCKCARYTFHAQWSTHHKIMPQGLCDKWWLGYS